MGTSYITGKYTASPVAGADGQDIQVAVDQYGNVKMAASGTAPVGGGITWGAPTAVASDGASKVLVAANAARKAISIWNPVGNAQMSVNIAGGTAVLATSRPLLAAFSIDLEGAACPVGAITFIGTNLQSLVYQEGT
jgi:hypothetical protein